jgi:hypothetical protein
MSEAADAARRGFEVRHNLKFDLHHRDDHELGDALPGLERVGLATAVPARDHELALVVRIDEADKIAEYDAMAMAKP